MCAAISGQPARRTRSHEHRSRTETRPSHGASLSDASQYGDELLHYEKIETTKPKAREASRLAERLITVAKAGDLNARRRVARDLKNPSVNAKLFDVIAPRYKERKGGYTQFVMTGTAPVRRGRNGNLESWSLNVQLSLQSLLQRHGY